jgi:hypothetical protein
MTFRSGLRLAGILLTVFFFITDAALANDVGVVKVSRGSASVERAGQRSPAPAGTRVRQGDTLITGPDGSLGVTFSDNSMLSIGPDSRLTIDRFTFDATTHKGAFETSLSRGTLAGVSGKIAKQTPGAMKVKTPAALLGVRGTEFAIRTGDPQ